MSYMLYIHPVFIADIFLFRDEVVPLSAVIFTVAYSVEAGTQYLIYSIHLEESH